MNAAQLLQMLERLLNDIREEVPFTCTTGVGLYDCSYVPTLIACRNLRVKFQNQDPINLGDHDLAQLATSYAAWLRGAQAKGTGHLVESVLAQNQLFDALLACNATILAARHVLNLGHCKPPASASKLLHWFHPASAPIEDQHVDRALGSLWNDLYPNEAFNLQYEGEGGYRAALVPDTLQWAANNVAPADPVRQQLEQEDFPLHVVGMRAIDCALYTYGSGLE